MTSPWATAADILDPVETWTLFPKQVLAKQLASKADELLFGGAAGPGKTFWGLHHCIGEMEQHDGNRGLIVRRVFPSLERTVIPRLKDMLGRRADWNGQFHRFSFPNKSILEVSSLQYADDVKDFQGAEYGVIFFEELTEFLQSQWEFLIGRLRAPVDGVRPHAIATTNPGGPGHTWVKRRFIAPKLEDLEVDADLPQPTQLWRPGRTVERPNPGLRAFVPATLADNPALLERDPGYIDRLRAISNRGLRLAMERGDWDAIENVEGALWQQSMFEWDGFYQRMPEQLDRIVVGVDPSGSAAGDACGIVVAGSINDVLWVLEDRTLQASPDAWARQVVQAYHDYEADKVVVESNFGGQMAETLLKQVDPTVPVKSVPSSRGKQLRAEPVAAIYEQKRARHLGPLLDLETEMTSWEPLAKGQPSPNRIDAMVFSATELILNRRPSTRGRTTARQLVSGKL